MSTEKQIAANRRNAHLSSGPRTNEGKARSAQNSLKHGLLATPALLPDEDETAFREFMEERIRDLDPVGPRESDLAQQIAFLSWRLIRFSRVEAGLFIVDRAERDYEFFGARVRQYQTSEYQRHLQELAKPIGYSDEVEITDEVRHAEARKNLSVAAEAKRSEVALLGSAFSDAASRGDPFGKLSRYETAAVNRLRRLTADFDELQARRKQSGDVPEETPPS